MTGANALTRIRRFMVRLVLCTSGGLGLLAGVCLAQHGPTSHNSDGGQEQVD